jgi:hypothetical protein
MWLRDPQDLYYVRQSLIHCPEPKGFPLVDRVHRLRQFAALVGYGESAELERESGPSYLRRVFWLTGFDRNYDPTAEFSAIYPDTAVDPLTVAPRVVGHKTTRYAGISLTAYTNSKNAPAVSVDAASAVLAARRSVSPTEEVITVVQAADEAGVSDTTIRAWMKKGIVEWTRRDGYCGNLIFVSSLRASKRS